MTQKIKVTAEMEIEDDLALDGLSMDTSLGLLGTIKSFEIDYEKKPTVMKIAKNEKGFRQNLAEVNIYKKFRNKPPFMVPMLSYDDNKDADTSWIHLMKATKFDEGEFYRYFDLSFNEFRKVLSDIINNQENENKNIS